MKRDKSQEEIVYGDINKSYLVIAPPGYGKTITMARRIIYIIENEKIRKNEKILGLTFTNAAANEMYKKLNLKKNIIEKKVLITTFHSFCYQILRDYGNLIKINNNFNIIGPLERREKLKNQLKNSGIEDDSIDNIFFNNFKKWIMERNLKLNDEYNDNEYNEIFKISYNNYLTEIFKENKIDFDGILLKIIELWEKSPHILELYRVKYRYLLIDEFQDTNALQYKILKYLINGVDAFQNKQEKINFMCFSDPFQSIYIFQGALADNVKILSDEFNCEIKELQINHRISSPLIDSINLFLRKGIEPEYDIIEKIDCILFDNLENESNLILNEIIKLKKNGIDLHNICIIARNYRRLNHIKETFEKHKIDFIFLKDFRSDTIEERYQEVFIKFDEIISKKKKYGKISKIFLEICDSLDYKMKHDLVLKTLYEFIKMYENRTDIIAVPTWKKLQLIKNDILLEINWGQIIREKIRNKVYVSSVHQVKGLEFCAVFFIGLENFTIPSTKMCIMCYNGRKVKKNEEFNIFYVGISRTKSKINLTSLKKVLTKGVEKNRSISCIVDKIRSFIKFFYIKQPEKLLVYDSIKCWKLKK